MQSEIGMNQSKDEGLASLGINARNVEFVQLPTLDFNWNDFIIRSKYFLIIVQQTQKKMKGETIRAWGFIWLHGPYNINNFLL